MNGEGGNENYAMESNSKNKLLDKLSSEIVAFVFTLVFCAMLFSSCNFREKAYYSHRENYIAITGTVDHINYNEDKSVLYLGISDMKSKLDDNAFKIEGENMEVVQRNGIDASRANPNPHTDAASHARAHAHTDARARNPHPRAGREHMRKTHSMWNVDEIKEIFQLNSARVVWPLVQNGNEAIRARGN